MAVDPFFRQPRTPEQWRARARAIQHQLKGLMIAQLLRGGADAPKHDPSIGGDGRGYDPNQPRVPAGHPDGGQWTNQASGDGARINDPRVLSDIEPDDPWILGADYAANFEHHWYAKHFYLRRPFSRVIDPGEVLTLHEDEIIDSLDRELLPKEYRGLKYEGSRPPRRPSDIRLPGDV
jgi:hypothetical protein